MFKTELSFALVAFNPVEKFPRRIIVREDIPSLVEALVDVLEDRLRERLFQTHPKPIGLATGRTMEPIYKSLVNRLKAWEYEELGLLLKGWCSFNLDEYVGLGEEDADSFKTFMGRHLGAPLDLSFEKLRLPNGRAKDLQLESDSYVQELIDCGGIGVQLLGLGTNGHIGFNEPPCEPDVTCRVVSLSEETRRQNASFFGGDPKRVPSMAITCGLSEILTSQEIHLVVTGAAKAEVLKDLLNSSCSELLPASWLRRHQNVFLWADEAAVGQDRCTD